MISNRKTPFSKACVFFAGLAMLSAGTPCIAQHPVPHHPVSTNSPVHGEAITREHDRLVRAYTSSAEMEAMFLEVYKLAGVAEQDKKGFYDLMYDKYNYVDKRDFIRKVNEGDITQVNAKQYWDFKRKEYAGYYTGAYLKGITTVIPSDAKPNQVKTLHNPPNTANACANNIDFEQGNFTGWSGNYATFNCSASPIPGTPDLPTNVGLDIGPTNSYNNQHTIMSSGFDPTVGGTVLPCVWPGGGNYSMRLGDTQDGCGEGDIEMSFLVTTTNTNFTYAFAVVLYDGHPAVDAPKFIMSMTDQAGNPIPCGQYSIDAVAASHDPTFFPVTPGCTFSCLYYRPWTPMYVSLNAYVGQTVTVKFLASDCDGGAHRGYAYIDCACNAVNAIAHDSLCSGHSALLIAPAGASHYSWNTGDTLQHINVTTPGNYTCTLTTAAGCTQTLFTNVVLYPSPMASFTPNVALCTPNASFTNTTTINPPGVIGSYTWNFGDGNFFSGANPPAHTYSSTGTYTVTLISASTNGCIDTTHTVIQPGIGSVAAFSFNTVCQGNATSFADHSTGAIGWSWNFGEPASGPNDSANVSNPSHIYSAPGTYTVTETEHNANCRGTIQHVISVNPLPAVSFTVAPGCMGKVISFTNTSTILSGGISGYSWNFNDPPSTVANTSTLANPTHTFNAPGTYSVVLTATSDSGCQKSITIPVVITPTPTVAFHVNDVCDGFPIQCRDTSSLVSTYAWNFGEPASSSNTSTLANPTHLYAAPGNYTIHLVGASASGCIDSAKINVLVYPSPEASFNSSTTQTTLSATDIFFTNTSTGFGPLTYHWDFGTGDTSTAVSPDHTYPTDRPGIYHVDMIVTTDKGCTDTAVTTISIGGEFTFYAPNAFTPDNNGLNDNFLCYGTGITKFEMMIFDRWGNLIFVSTDLNKGWDGKYYGTGASSNTICQQDVYVYKVTLTDISGNTHKYIGSVSLIK